MYNYGITMTTNKQESRILAAHRLKGVFEFKTLMTFRQALSKIFDCSPKEHRQQQQQNTQSTANQQTIKRGNDIKDKLNPDLSMDMHPLGIDSERCILEKQVNSEPNNGTNKLHRDQSVVVLKSNQCPFIPKKFPSNESFVEKPNTQRFIASKINESISHLPTSKTIYYLEPVIMKQKAPINLFLNSERRHLSVRTNLYELPLMGPEGLNKIISKRQLQLRPDSLVQNESQLNIWDSALNSVISEVRQWSPRTAAEIPNQLVLPDESIQQSYILQSNPQQHEWSASLADFLKSNPDFPNIQQNHISPPTELQTYNDSIINKLITSREQLHSPGKKMSETSGETPRKMHILKKEDDDDKDVIEEYRDQVEIRNDKKTQPRNAVRNSPKNAQRIEVMNNVRNEVMNNARTEVKNTVRAEVKNGVMNNLRNNSNLYTQNAKIDVQSNTSKQSQNRRLSAFDKSRFIQLLQQTPRHKQSISKIKLCLPSQQKTSRPSAISPPQKQTNLSRMFQQRSQTLERPVSHMSRRMDIITPEKHHFGISKSPSGFSDIYSKSAMINERVQQKLRNDMREKEYKPELQNNQPRVIHPDSQNKQFRMVQPDLQANQNRILQRDNSPHFPVPSILKKKSTRQRITSCEQQELPEQDFQIIEAIPTFSGIQTFQQAKPNTFEPVHIDHGYQKRILVKSTQLPRAIDMKKHYQQQQAPQMQMEGTLLRSTNLPTNKVIPQAPQYFMKYSLNYQTNQNKNQNCVIAQNIQYNSARQSTNSNIKHFDLNLKQTSNTNPSSNMNTNQNFNINPLSNINPNNNHNINPIIYNAPIVKNNHVTTSDDKMTFGSFLSHCSVSPQSHTPKQQYHQTRQTRPLSKSPNMKIKITLQGKGK